LYQKLAPKLLTSNADFNDEQWKRLEISKDRKNAGSFLGCWLLILEKTHKTTGLAWKKRGFNIFARGGGG